MKVLMLVQADHGSTAFESLYDEMGRHFEVFDLRWLSGKEQADLKSYFHQNVDVDKYDRIVSFIRLKKEIKQVRFYRTIPNLVFLEYDACQNYMAGSKYRGIFSRHYKKIPWVKVISSGYAVAKKLESEGIDTVFVPKGYDNTLISNFGMVRDIEMGFVGNLRNKTYLQRRLFLEDLSNTHGVRIEKTVPGAPYNEMLNRIKYFISADIGIGEYMQKNFEAMAAGCIVFALDQGMDENEAFGLKDLENIVLYENKEDLLAKKKILENDQVLKDKIKQQGQELSKRYTNSEVAKLFYMALSQPLRTKTKQNFFRTLLGL